MGLWRANMPLHKKANINKISKTQWQKAKQFGFDIIEE